jgi:hypothetical protein
MKINRILLLAVVCMSACIPAPEVTNEPDTVPPDTAVTNPPAENPSLEPVKNPYEPQPADSGLTRDEVFINEMDILIRESFPPQISLTLSGELPTPCHQLRVQTNEPDAENKIKLEAYSVVNPDMICIQVLEPFQASIDLGTFPSGRYSVWVNDELAGEFDS